MRSRSPCHGGSVARRVFSWASPPGRTSSPPSGWPSGWAKANGSSRCCRTRASATWRWRREVPVLSAARPERSRRVEGPVLSAFEGTGAGSNQMSVMVYIPTPFRRLAGNQSYVKAEGQTVGEVLDSLGTAYPGLRDLIYDAADEIPGHINIYINSQEIHSLQGKQTPVKDGDEMAVIPAIAGGQDACPEPGRRGGARVLTPEQVNRYSRHIIMPQVGPAGQRKLMEAKVLIV